MIDKVMKAPAEAILKISEAFEKKVGKPTETFDSFVCDSCGDNVVETYGRVVGDKKVCIPCQQKLLGR